MLRFLSNVKGTATVLTLLLFFLFFVPTAFAHRPVFTDDAGTGAETAITMGDPAVSQVVYRDIEKNKKQIWLEFTVPKDFKLYIQMGVPNIERLKTFRPSMVVVGPGLPTDKPPFKLPEKMGAKVYPTKDVKKPREFHEHFTGTDSWILRSDDVQLTKPGKYYLVATVPEGEVGKLWLSIGRKESFTMKDWLDFPKWTKKIRAFHEVK